MSRIDFMNIKIDNMSLDETVESIRLCVEKNNKLYVVTPNVDHMVKLQHDLKFLLAYQKAGIVAVDGTPIILAAKWYGTPLKEKITGPRLTEKVIEMASNQHFRVFFLGAGKGVGEIAAQNMLSKYPNYEYVGYYSPPFGFENNEHERKKIINIINESSAQIVIAGMGSPKTEIFLSEIYSELNANVSLSVGAAIDFLAGTVKRCPEWINKIGMEWLFRFIKDPKRMGKRYFVDDIVYLKLLLRYKFRK